jgi:membrane-associated phospholipid phosphatase
VSSSAVRSRLSRLVRERPLGRAVCTLAVAGLILLGSGLILGFALVGRHGGGPMQGWDDTVWHWSTRHRGPLIGVAKMIGTVGDAALLGPLCVVLGVVMLMVRRSPAAVAPVLAYLGGEGLVFLIREVIRRHRPPTANYPAPGAVPGVHETSFSYPSGHSVAVTAVFFAVLGLLAISQRVRSWWLLALCLSALVADSRLLLGVHWFSDVAVGMVLGVSWGVVVALVCTRLTWHDLNPATSGDRSSRAESPDDE